MAHNKGYKRVMPQIYNKAMFKRIRGQTSAQNRKKVARLPSTRDIEDGGEGMGRVVRAQGSYERRNNGLIGYKGWMNIELYWNKGNTRNKGQR